MDTKSENDPDPYPAGDGEIRRLNGWDDGRFNPGLHNEFYANTC